MVTCDNIQQIFYLEASHGSLLNSLLFPIPLVAYNDIIYDTDNKIISSCMNQNTYSCMNHTHTESCMKILSDS